MNSVLFYQCYIKTLRVGKIIHLSGCSTYNMVHDIFVNNYNIIFLFNHDQFTVRRITFR